MGENTLSWYEAEKYVDKTYDFYCNNGISFGIKNYEIVGSSIKIRVKFKKATSIEKMRRLTSDAKLYLKVDRFEVVQEGNFIFIYITIHLPRPEHLLKVLSNHTYIDRYKGLGLIHPLGIDSTGALVTADITKYPHALVAGTSGSGKTCALKSMLTTLVGTYSPNELNLIIGDKSGDLEMFSVVPHLSCPIVKNAETLLKVMLILRDELERRTKLNNTSKHTALSKIVCVIDEFTTFISELEMSNKKRFNMLVKVINDILQRGRHAAIHLVLTTHNPTRESIKISTCNAPTRLVFRVANINISLTALGEKGAEKLQGNGDLLFSMNGEIKHLQGFFLTDKEIENYLQKLDFSYLAYFSNGFTISSEPYFTINQEALKQEEIELDNHFHSINSLKGPMANTPKNDELFVKVLNWTLQQDSISANRIIDAFGIGWRRAKEYIEKLQKFNIVDNLNAKLPRNVIPKSIEDLPKELIDLLNTNGYDIEKIDRLFCNNQDS